MSTPKARVRPLSCPRQPFDGLLAADLFWVLQAFQVVNECPLRPWTGINFFLLAQVGQVGSCLGAPPPPLPSSFLDA